MLFSIKELERINELLQWGKNKNIKDEDFLSAIEKFNRLLDIPNLNGAKITPRYTIEKGDFGYLNRFSEATQQFIMESVQNGEVNPFLSIKSVLANHHNGRGGLQSLDKEYDEYIKKHQIASDEIAFYQELFQVCYEDEEKKDVFKYLDKLSENARQLVISKVEANQKNPYASMMSIIGNRMQHHTLQDVDTEFKKYKSKAGFDAKDEEVYREIFTYCYNKKVSSN